MARAVETCQPFLFEVRIFSAAIISAYRSISASGATRVFVTPTNAHHEDINSLHPQTFIGSNWQIDFGTELYG